MLHPGRTRRRLPAFVLALLVAAGLCAAPASAVAQAPAQHRIGFDKYSLMLDGRRQVVWSGEFHPFRLPSPDLWRDVLQKMKATGYTAVSI
ncbi:beta-galactosidase, partial [Amycolatopsis sp. NPDC051045]|uniref:beta-galactosidase n=1 Tax=Amycolatopsis sp. NPDC051045 TaxID=3156922 RepID=UPI003439AD43